MNIDFEDDEVRPPDNVRTECLIQDTRSEYEQQIDEAIYQSIKDIENVEKINKEYEEIIIQTYFKETIERKNKFSSLLMDVNRLIRFDKNFKEIYEIIEPIIESYCNQYIENIELDEVTYDTIFKFLGTIRTNKSNIENLKTLIIKSK